MSAKNSDELVTDIPIPRGKLAGWERFVHFVDELKQRNDIAEFRRFRLGARHFVPDQAERALGREYGLQKFFIVQLDSPFLCQEKLKETRSFA